MRTCTFNETYPEYFITFLHCTICVHMHVYMYVYYNCVCSLIRITLLGCGHSVTVKIIFNVLLWVVVTPTQWEQLLSQGLSVCLSICVFAVLCLYLYVSVYMCLCVCVCVRARMSVCLYIRVCVCAYVCIFVFECMCI